LQNNQYGAERLFVFDLLWCNGEDLRSRPLSERRDLLESVLTAPPAEIQIAERIALDAEAARDRSRERGYEGIIAKVRDSVYDAGRSRNWRKLKIVNAQEVAIVGFTDSSASRTQIGALLIGVVENGALRFAGKVGTGFSAQQRAELKRALAKDIVTDRIGGAPRLRDAHCVKPRLVAQVRFSEWTPDGKLRHPVFEGLRPDKSPSECVRETPLAKSAPRKSKPAREITLSHPERVYYPRDGITKQDIAEYYRAVSRPFLAALRDRPVSFERWPRGISSPSFYSHDIEVGKDSWLTTATSPTTDGSRNLRHLMIDSEAALTWLAQHAVLTVHGWLSTMQRLTSPDWLVFDLDPGKGADIRQTVPIALSLKKLLDKLALPSVPKTSGKAGLHVMVPLAVGHTFDDSRNFALALASLLVGAHPEATTARSIAQRRGRMYIDCMQNGYGKTVVAPYSPRAIAGAPVSTPLAWREVTAQTRSRSFHGEDAAGASGKSGRLVRADARPGCALAASRAARDRSTRVSDVRPTRRLCRARR